MFHVLRKIGRFMSEIGIHHSMGVLLRGPGVYVPEHILTNPHIVGLKNETGDGPLIETSDEAIVDLSGIHERRFSLDKDVIEMGRLAVEDLFTRLNYDREKIQEVRFATNWHVHNHGFPAHAGQTLTGLEKFAMSDGFAGCSGLGYAIRDAFNAVSVGEKEAVLVIGSERLLHYTDFSDRSTCFLFGDGAVAYIVERSSLEGGIIANEVGGEADRKKYLAPDTKLGHQLTLTKDGSFTTQQKNLEFLTMNGREVMRYASRIMQDATRLVAQRAGIDMNRINVIIPHGANIRIIDRARGYLTNERLPEQDRFQGEIYTNLDRFGNTSTASTGIAAREAIDKGIIKDGDIVAQPTFGAGFTWAVSLYQYRDTEQ